MKNDKDLKFGRINKLFNLKDHIIVLTGSAGLLGSQYAQILSDAGATLVLVDTNTKKNQDLQNKINKKFDVYLIDTYGESEKFYSISKSVFLGKSIETHGGRSGQNPLEATREGCKIYNGHYVSNFQEIYFFLNKKRSASTCPIRLSHNGSPQAQRKITHLVSTRSQ